MYGVLVYLGLGIFFVMLAYSTDQKLIDATPNRYSSLETHVGFVIAMVIVVFIWPWMLTKRYLMDKVFREKIKNIVTGT